MERELENFKDHGCHIFRDLVDPRADEKMWICSIFLIKHKILIHCAERKAKLLGNWTMQFLKLHVLFWEMFCQYLRD